MAIHIRPERPEDFPAIHELVRMAFASAEHSDGGEHFLVHRLRLSPEYIPELSLVAVEDQEKGQIIGHIMFTKVKIGEVVQLAVAPLSVLPAHQGEGVGGILMRHGHAVACALGWEFAILLGHKDYYPRFGYKRASLFGILAPFEVPDEAFMAINLRGGPDHLPGMVEYSKAFFPSGS